MTPKTPSDRQMSTRQSTSNNYQSGFSGWMLTCMLSLLLLGLPNVSATTDERQLQFITTVPPVILTLPPEAEAGGNVEDVAATMDPMEFNATDLTTTFTYTIFVANGTQDDVQFEEYADDLILSVDSLVLAVQLFPSNSDRRSLLEDKSRMKLDLERQRRELAVQLGLPSSFQSVRNVGFTNEPRISPAGKFLGGPCPSQMGDPEIDSCLEITSLIEIIVTGDDPEDEEQAVKLKTNLERAIDTWLNFGWLQEIFSNAAPDSPVIILSGLDLDFLPTIAPSEDFSNATETMRPDEPRSTPPPIDNNDESDGIVTGVIIGILMAVLGALCCIYLMVVFVVRRKKTQEDPKGSKATDQPSSEADNLAFSGLEWGDPQGNGKEKSSDYMSNDEFSLSAVSSSHVDGSGRGSAMPPALQMDNISYLSDDIESYSLANENRKSKKAKEKEAEKESEGPLSLLANAPFEMYRFVEDFISGGTQEDEEESVQSHNTEDSGDVMGGARVVDLRRVLEDNNQWPAEPRPGVTNLDDLEAAIMNGDWAALAATASTLAAEQYDTESEVMSRTSSRLAGTSGAGTVSITSYPSQGNSHGNSQVSVAVSGGGSEWSNRSKEWKNNMDAEKAADLDRWIHDGDWGAIIDAAAKYGAETAL